MQGGIGLTINEPFWSNDRLYVQYMDTLEGLNNTHTKSDNQNFYASYRYPFKHWQLHLSYNNSRYTQALKGFNHDPIYKGSSERKHIEISKTLYRTSNAQLGAYMGLSHKEAKSYIDDLEILVQRRKTTDYTVGASYEKTLPKGQLLNIDVSVNRGIAAFGAKPISQHFYSEVGNHPLIWQIDTSYRVPFSVDKHNFNYHIHTTGQYTYDRLELNEQGRYSVRGFDKKDHWQMGGVSLWPKSYPTDHPPKRTINFM